MFKANAILIILFSLSSCTQTTASDHLVPDDSIYSSSRFENYYRAVNNVLTQLEPEGTIARVIVRPSFSPEKSVGVFVVPESKSRYESINDKYFIFTRKLDRQIWRDDDLSFLPYSSVTAFEIVTKEKKLEVPPHQLCTKQIDRDLAKSIQSVFEEMLLQTRYERNPQMGADGATYNFGTIGPGKWLSGHTWSPKPNSKTGQLVDIVTVMSDYCESNTEDGASRLENLTNKLSSRLNGASGS